MFTPNYADTRRGMEEECVCLCFVVRCNALDSSPNPNRSSTPFSLFSATSCHCVCVPTEAGSSYARTNLIFGFEVNEDGSLYVIPVTLNVKLHVIRITGFYGCCGLRRVARVLAVAIWRCAYLIMTDELVTHRVRTQTLQSCAVRYSFKLITQSKRVLVT